MIQYVRAMDLHSHTPNCDMSATGDGCVPVFEEHDYVDGRRNAYVIGLLLGWFSSFVLWAAIHAA